LHTIKDVPKFPNSGTCALHFLHYHPKYFMNPPFREVPRVSGSTPRFRGVPMYGEYCYLPLPLRVRSMKAATLACSAFKSGSWAYTMCPDV
jgi:hypothetical protein